MNDPLQEGANSSDGASARAGGSPRKRHFEVLIDESLCRSCQVCIAFCPTDVLSSRFPLRKAEVVNIEACIGCRLCELLCPDWAVTMHEVKPAVSTEAVA